MATEMAKKVWVVAKEWKGNDAGALTVGTGGDGGRSETQEISAGTGGAEDGKGWEEV